MSLKQIPALFLVAALFAVSGVNADSSLIPHLDAYRDQGIEQTNAGRGGELWYASINDRGCTSCHGASPANIGEHVKTGKSIEPMALSVNPDRYQRAKKIEKWFLRNCKWTFGRECSLQEKADILTWLASQ
jgi:hypothetical protein